MNGNFDFNPARFFEALPYMGLGMFGIFVVIGLIICVIVLLNKITAGKKDKK